MALIVNTGTLSDITDYGSLLDRLREWLDRGNELDALLATFIGNAEAVMNRELRTPEMEVTVPITAVDGSFLLPLDCLQVRFLASDERAMTGARPFEGRCRDRLAYSLSGRTMNTMAAGALLLSYWRRIPALGTANPSNWLLDAHQDVYLYGALFQACTYTGDGEAAAGWSTLFDAALSGIERSARAAQYAGPLVMRVGVNDGYGRSTSPRIEGQRVQIVNDPVAVPGEDEWDRTEW